MQKPTNTKKKKNTNFILKKENERLLNIQTKRTQTLSLNNNRSISPCWPPISPCWSLANLSPRQIITVLGQWSIDLALPGDHRSKFLKVWKLTTPPFCCEEYIINLFFLFFLKRVRFWIRDTSSFDIIVYPNCLCLFFSLWGKILIIIIFSLLWKLK